MNAFKSISTSKSTGLGAVAGGISEALITTAVGLFVAIPAVWMFNYFTNRIEAFDVEMGNSSSELIDYFLKRTQRRVARRATEVKLNEGKTAPLVGQTITSSISVYLAKRGV